MLEANDCNREYERFEDKLEEVNALLSKASYSDARDILESLASSGYEPGFVYLALGDVSIALEDNEKAKEYLTKAMTIEPGDTQVVVAAKASLGKLYLREAFADFGTLRPEAQIEELISLIPNCAKESVAPMQVMLFSSPCLFPCTHNGQSYNNNRKTLTAGCRPCA